MYNDDDDNDYNNSNNNNNNNNNNQICKAPEWNISTVNAWNVNVLVTEMFHIKLLIYFWEIAPYIRVNFQQYHVACAVDRWTDVGAWQDYKQL